MPARGLWLVLLLSAPESSPPLDLDVHEETGAALAQIDVTLTGPAEALARVRPESFALWVGDRRVEHLLVDGSCLTAAEGPAPPPQVRPVTWLLYFDQPHLTIAGRARSIQLARDVLPEILRNGDRALIVSNARSLVTVQPMTSELKGLLAGLDRLEKDQTQFDSYAAYEPARLREVASTPLLHRPSIIRRFAAEERWQAKRDFHRLSTVLGSLADADPPKAVLYFADTTRRNPGAHYADFLSWRGGSALGFFPGELEQDPATLDILQVTRQAAAFGIRFYTVEPQALQGTSTRLRDAQGALQWLARETGGQAFVNGASVDRIVTGVRKDQACGWLLSFDPEGLARDRTLTVRVEIDVPHVKIRTRGQIEFQSATQRRTDRLLGQFALGTEAGASPLRAALVPLAWKDGEYSALLQVVAPPTSLPGVTWDLGASVVAAERIAAQTSARTKIDGANVAVALESVVALRPGPFELVAVAREVTTDKVFSSHTEGTWPSPEDALAEVVQPVVLQPGPGAFTRDGQIRKSGSLVHGKDDPLDASRPTALVALVCRSKMVKTPLDVTRVLEGVSPVEFPPLTLDLKDERCGQVRDMIPASTLGPGRYRYAITVREKGTVIGTGETSFVVE